MVICTTGNVMARSDTVAIALRTIVYMVLHDERLPRRLPNDINAANISFPIAEKECQQLPCLDAMVQESLRIHRLVGFGLVCVASTDGLAIRDGTHIPNSAQASMNGHQ